MTKEEILAMEAGEQLNEQVAGEIMSECYHQHWAGSGDSINCLKCGKSRFYHQRSQAYSTDISAAWQVVERLISQDCNIEVGGEDYPYTQYGKWHCQINFWVDKKKNKSKIVGGFGKAAPEAICKAALIAKCSLENIKEV